MSLPTGSQEQDPKIIQLARGVTTPLSEQVLSGTSTTLRLTGETGNLLAVTCRMVAGISLKLRLQALGTAIIVLGTTNRIRVQAQGPTKATGLRKVLVVLKTDSIRQVAGSEMDQAQTSTGRTLRTEQLTE